MENKCYEVYPVKVKKLYEDSQIPTYGTSGAAGLDLYSHDDTLILPWERKLIDTGIAIDLSAGTENLLAFITPRSGLALKNGITVLNSPGLLDSDYRGSLGIILFNSSTETFKVEKGMRIAQMVILSYKPVNFELVEDLSSTDRNGGFGSTGVK